MFQQPSAPSAPRLVPAVDRAARMLGALRREGRPLGISELARLLAMNKGTARDILETLRHHALVERDDGSKRYRLGPGLLGLAASRRAAADLPKVAHAIVARLAAEAGETVVLAVPDRDRLVLVDKAEAEREWRVSASVGMRLPIAAGCLGKAVLAHLPAVRRDELLAGGALRPFTARSILEPARYLEALAETRRTGVALDDEEYLVGVRAVGAPILSDQGLTAALAVVGFARSLADDRLPALGALVRAAAAEISHRLGAVAARVDGSAG